MTTPAAPSAYPSAAPTRSHSAAASTGIEGLDFVLDGGLPVGSPTLLRGGPGSGKTAIALTFFAHGLTTGHPGVLVTFDESPQALIGHAQALGFPLQQLLDDGLGRILDMRPVHSEQPAGEGIELSAVLARIGHALECVDGERLVIDAIDGIDAFYSAHATLRSELSRVFNWIRERGATTLITTGEHNDFSGRFGLEDYIADCVILLRQEMQQRSMTRLLRILKRRGGGHGTNEFPFLLDAEGVFMAPITGSSLEASVSEERHSTGVVGLDQMLGGQGPYRGSAIMISGQSGTGKTTFAAAFAQAVCDRGGRVLYLSFEESSAELIRNQRSVGVDLTRHFGEEDAGPLYLKPLLASELGWEEHLLRVMRQVEALQPAAVILDPISSMTDRWREGHSREMMLRLFYRLKKKGVTVVATELLGDASTGVSTLNISSLVDVWIKLRRDERDDVMRRLLTVVKARGMPTPDHVALYSLTSSGVVFDDGQAGGGRP